MLRPVSIAIAGIFLCGASWIITEQTENKIVMEKLAVDPGQDIDPINSVIVTDGSRIVDSCGEEIVLRGVNHMTVWVDWDGVTRDGLPMFHEIAKTGANTVRIVWDHTQGSAKELGVAIGNAIANKLIAIPELHNLTCNFNKTEFEKITKFWVDNAEIWKRYEKHLIINYANEVGAWGSDVKEITAAYIDGIKRIREANINAPIMIDAPKCGQDYESLLSMADSLITSDPIANIIFSVHAWFNKDDNKIAEIIKKFKDKDIPLVFAEFSNINVDCKTATSYKKLMQLSAKEKVGWLPWSWGPQNECIKHSVTKDGKATGLTTVGKEIFTTGTYSVKKTGKKTYLMENGKCK